MDSLLLKKYKYFYYFLYYKVDIYKHTTRRPLKQSGDDAVQQTSKDENALAESAERFLFYMALMVYFIVLNRIINKKTQCNT